MNETILAKYGEIILKGGNRPRFEKVLLKNIENALREIDDADITLAQATIYIKPTDSSKMDLICERLTKVFGIVSVTRAAECEKDLDVIKETALSYCGDDLSGGVSFKVDAKRSDKKFPYTSQDLGIEVGGFLHDKCKDLRVDVHNPDKIVRVEIRDFNAYVYIVQNKLKGQGGMPIGTGLKASLLLSGGIDSPVAGHMIAKRGIEIEAINFFSYPYTSERAKEKVIELASIVAQYTSKIDLYIVPFTDIQLKIRDNCPEEHLTLIMRRFMMRIAEKLARIHKTNGLITGESVGQVASQTLSALDVTNSVVDMPVLRPLIGMDKEEIIERARKIGTFETSILPYEDCCTVFTPKHPTTNPKRSSVIKTESVLDIETLVKEAVDGTEKITVYPKEV